MPFSYFYISELNLELLPIVETCYREGCTSDWADNYDELATTDDGSCDRLGCMSDWADNYDELATTDDESCDRLGCMSDWADNYDNQLQQMMVVVID